MLGPGRQNQKNLTPEARKALLRRIKDFIASDEDPVGYHRENGHVHGTPNFLPWHRVFLQRFEDWQLTRLRNSSDFIPLVFWDPGDTFPVEFRQPDINPDPGLPDLWSELDAAGGLEVLDYTDFSRIVEEHHNAAHDALGGGMLDPMVSPQVPVFWLLHSFYDHVFHTWEERQESAAA